MSTARRLYEFVYRGQLTEEGLDRAGRMQRRLPSELDASMAIRLGLDLMDEGLVEEARQMAVVYTAIAAFENSVRKFVETVLVEGHKESWWEKGVSEKIRKKADSRQREEERIKWHGQRGESPLHYTDMGELGTIIRINWTLFEPFMPTIEWAENIFNVIERSRNVIMHSGTLSAEDVERVGVHIRDWIKQVGG